MTGEATDLLAATGAPPDDPAERLGVLFDAHQKRLYRLARRLCRTADEARDPARHRVDSDNQRFDDSNQPVTRSGRT